LPSTSPLNGLIDNCLFDSDPRQMKMPRQYVSAQELWVTRRHLYLDGNCQNLTVSQNEFNHALFAIWSPALAPFIATGNKIRDFYIAGMLNMDIFTSAYQLTGNQFTFPPADNEISRSHGPQLRAAYEVDLATATFPVLREGACVGIYGSSVETGSLFTLNGNSFVQPTPLPRYGYDVGYPQYGVVTNGGRLENNTFQNLHVGYRSLSTQQGGLVKGNLFEGCYRAG
jgi:hypothetical protein